MCVSERYTLGNEGERERQEDIFAVDQESPLAPPLPMRKKYSSLTYQKQQCNSITYILIWKMYNTPGLLET